MEFEHIQRLVGSILSASVSQAIKIIKSTRANGSVPRSGLEKWNITGYAVKYSLLCLQPLQLALSNMISESEQTQEHPQRAVCPQSPCPGC